MLFHQGFDQRQAQAGALARPHGIILGLFEGQADPLQGLSGDTDTGVANRQVQGSFPCRDAQ
jgi:hypothetical protein